MPFERPTLTELINRAAADIEVELPGTDARLRRSNLGVLARVQAAGAHGLHGHLQWLARQLMIDTCDADYLDRYGAIWGVVRTPAQFAQGPVTLTGTNGSVVPAGTTLQRANGQVYATVAEVTIASGTATPTVAANTAGAEGNALEGSPLSLVSPVAGVNANAVAGSGGLVGGADSEADDALRARLLQRLQQPPKGGAATDYVAWALSVPGVTRAWCYPLEGGPGTVTVRFMRDNDTPSPIPSAGEVSAVQAVIDELRPVTANVTVAAPTAAALNFTIHVSPDTSEVRAAVEASLRDLIFREAEPGGTLLLSHIREAISGAAGEADSVVSAPAANVVAAAGAISTMGTITWV